jgi:hypothetical protein
VAFPCGLAGDAEDLSDLPVAETAAIPHVQDFTLPVREYGQVKAGKVLAGAVPVLGIQRPTTRKCGSG